MKTGYVEPIQKRREAKLIELIQDNNLNSRYSFMDFDDFKNPGKNSRLIYLTFSDSMCPAEVKEKAIENFNGEAHKSLGLFGNSWKYYDKDIDEIKKDIEKSKVKLENSRFWNWHLPWKKSYWKKVKERGNSIVFGMIDIVADMCIGGGIYGCIANNVDEGMVIMCITGATIKGALELGRIVNKNSAQEELKESCEKLQIHNNFKSNLEKSKIEIVSPKEAQEIFEEVKKSRQSGKYGVIDINAANNDLMNIYNKY